MFRLSPQLLIATTRALVGMGVTERDFGDPEFAEPIDGSSLPLPTRRSWDARFILQCGYWAHYEHRSRSSSWPIPPHLTTPEMALFGLAHGVLYDVPIAGDIFLQWGQHRRMFIHCGVVADVLASYRASGVRPSFDVYAIEGDTDEYGRLQRGKAMRVRRRLSPAMGDRFLRWVELERDDVRHMLKVAERATTPGRSAR